MDLKSERHALTVVMSCYERDNAEYLLEAVNSIRNQTVPADHIIIVADGRLSADLDDAISRLEGSGDITTYRLPENRGLGFARDFAIREANSRYIAVMDADDISRSDRFEKQLSALENRGADIVGGYIREFSSSGSALRRVPLTHEGIFERGKYRSPFNHVTVMFKREAYIAAGGYRAIRGVEDYDLWHRMLMTGSKATNLSDVLVDVRFGSDDIYRRRGLPYLRCWLQLLREMRQSGYISVTRYLALSVGHTILRLSPAFCVGYFYKLLRRR